MQAFHAPAPALSMLVAQSRCSNLLVRNDYFCTGVVRFKSNRHIFNGRILRLNDLGVAQEVRFVDGVEFATNPQYRPVW